MEKNYYIASWFDMYINMGEKLVGRKYGYSLIIESHPPPPTWFW